MTIIRCTDQKSLVPGLDADTINIACEYTETMYSSVAKLCHNSCTTGIYRSTLIDRQ